MYNYSSYGAKDMLCSFDFKHNIFTIRYYLSIILVKCSRKLKNISFSDIFIYVHGILIFGTFLEYP